MRKILIQDRQQPGPQRNKLPDSTTLEWRKKQINVSQTHHAQSINVMTSAYRPYGALKWFVWEGEGAELSQRLDTGCTMAPQSPARFQRSPWSSRIGRFSEFTTICPHATRSKTKVRRHVGAIDRLYRL